MSILNTVLPESVEISGENYGIYTDFRRWINFEEIMKITPPAHRYAEMFKKYYISLPPEFSKAVYALCKFYAGGIMPQKNTSGSSRKLYSYKQDADLIYCAFYAQYHVDLERETMHWWKFLTLLSGLDEKCRFMQIVRLRAMNLNEIKDKNERTRIAGLQRKYALADERSNNIKDADFADKISMLF